MAQGAAAATAEAEAGAGHRNVPEAAGKGVYVAQAACLRPEMASFDAPVGGWAVFGREQLAHGRARDPQRMDSAAAGEG